MRFLLLVWFLSPWTATAVDAQASLLLVNVETRVRSVGFRFLDSQTFEASTLSELLAYTDPGFGAGVKRRLSFLPLIGRPTLQSFAPIELQRDVARLRRFYRRAGFRNAEIRYDVRYDLRENEVRVTFEIREGEPIRRGDFRVPNLESSAEEGLLPAELRPAWRLFVEQVRPRAGERIGEVETAQLREALTTWLRDRGWAFARVESEVVVDSVAGVADVTLIADPGPRARVDVVSVQGNQRIDGWVVRRGIPLRAGDPFSAELLAQGQEHLYGLDMVRSARTEVPNDQPIDSTVTIVAHIEEGLPRVISGEAGYSTEAGLTASASWSHRDFISGARTLTISTTAQTALLAYGGADEVRYGGSVSLKQPFLFDPAVTGIGRPFVDYRDDLRDRSWEAGADLTVVHQAQRSRSLSVRYGFSQRRVLEYRGAGAANGDFLTRLAISDSLATNVRTSALTATWLTERLDDARDPTLGYVFRVSGQMAGPSRLSTVQYGRLDVSAAAFTPLGGGATLLLRVGSGRLFPYGKSLPAVGENPIRSILLLRGALFTAGGSYDVRGWGEQLLGPKTPDAVGDLDTPETLSATRYVPVGGLAREQATVELRLPMPFVGRSHGLFWFLDEGRVWTSNPRFGSQASDDQRRFYSTGGGLQFATPVGPVRLAVGYKLNPSVLDVRDPNDVLRALVENRSILELPTRGIRRYHLHLALGRSF